MHSAGATVVHEHPFKSLEVPALREPLPDEMRDRWVMPLYMKLHGHPDNAVQDKIAAFVIERWSEMTEDLARSLLENSGWRPRLVGAYLAAFKDFQSLTVLIGRLLLRSDVCYAGTGYCVALARFNAPQATAFLLEYLNYYLTRNDLFYDQGDAMAAIAHLDAMNGTNYLESLMEKWKAFVVTKPHWDLRRHIALFEMRMRAVASFGKLVRR